ncbi:MAG TPA: 2-isopropylmalate synthase [Burkholderiaceae bacterium]|nr:2-isopropylmalate synthase [Burkholderiaceae bacterium]
MISHPQSKYRPFPPIDLPDRQWPSRGLDRAPRWLSTDLRDGNQALFEPMSPARKLRLWEELVRIGFKEIELGFPSASQMDFDAVRAMIEGERIPVEVTPMVMTQAREDQIERTVESLRGARRAIVHLYNATAPVWRQVVFGMTVPQVMDLVERHVHVLRRLTDRCPQTEWVLQYSPETFCMTELEVSLEACHRAIRAWDAGPGRPVIINLPATVEVSTPNVFADQIEWMDRRLDRREHVVLSVHPHNDRGTGVACAELAMLAGAQRVEGCLFGNGERSGNVDLVTLALNLYTQGVHPGLDFSDLPGVARVAEACTSLPIHPRHPYVGDLVFTAFSGSHQDAIKKGLAARTPGGRWEVPYLPIDPADLGRTYDGVIRVNSQSGKGGIAYLLERDHGVVLPRRMQVEFSAVVQRRADASETEISSQELWALFEATYLAPATQVGSGAVTYRGHRLVDLAGQPGGQGIDLEVLAGGRLLCLQGRGNGPIDAAVNALGLPLRVDSYEERSLGTGAQAQVLAVVELATPGVAGTRFGAGRHEHIVTASILAVVSAVARLGVHPQGPSDTS